MAATRLKVQGKEYTFDLEKELTVGRLKRIKGWYGPELGRYGAFFRAFAEMDPDAMLCAVWIARTAAGEENVPDPNLIGDFGLDEWEMGAQPEETREDPPTVEAPTPTPGSSTGTPTNSEPDTSESSPTSAT